MKKAFLGLGVTGVTLVLSTTGGGCSNEVQVQFGGAGGTGGAQNVVSVGDTQPVTNTSAHATVGTTGQSMVTNVSATTTNVSVSTTGVSNDASSNVSTVTATASVTSSGTTMSVASTSTGMGLCLGTPGDSQCTQCAKSDCCAELTACFSENGNCDCWALCTEQNPNSPFQCFQQCGQPDQAAIQLGQCTNQNCQADCNGVQPAGSSVAATGVGSSVAASTGSGNPQACQPGFNDNACTTCTKNSCCSDVESCSNNFNCGCWVNCLRQGFSTQQCTQGCGAQTSVTTQLLDCSATECPTACN